MTQRAAVAAASGLAALPVVVALSLSVVPDPAFAAGFVLLFSGLVVWFSLPTPDNATPRWFTLFLIAMAFSSVLPPSVSLLTQAIAVAIAYISWFTGGKQRQHAKTFGWASAVVFYWAILVFHLNIPTLEIGILGLRKTAFCVIGLLIGLAMHIKLGMIVERSTMRVLASSVAVSIILHVFFPGLEQTLVSRDADIWTGLFDGEARLQGVYAGPFHAATAGLVLMVWGMARFAIYKVEAVLMLLVGTIAVSFSMVRTAFVALAIAVALMILVAPTVGKLIRRALLALMVGIAGIAVFLAISPGSFDLIASIFGFSTDTRFLGRLSGYEEGLQAFVESPLFGWGAGAAGDTLGASFTSGFHVTPHNVLLKIGVEGGGIGLLLWVGLIVSIFRAIPRSSPSKSLIVGVIGVLFGMGLTGSSVEALPPTFFAFLIVGLAMRSSAPVVSSGTYGASLRGVRSAA